MAFVATAVYLMVYTDSSFVSSCDDPSPVFVQCTPGWAGRQSGHSAILKQNGETRRTLRSGAQSFTVADVVDIAILLHYDLQDTLKKELPLRVLTDRSSLSFMVVNSTKTTEKYLMINLRAAMEAI